MELKSLVVLGGGFGGLSTAKTLAKQAKGKYHIILIDRNPVQIFTPTLPELKIDEIDLKAVAKKFGFEFQVNEILNLDAKNKTIKLAERTIAADGLILALGTATEYFGIPGLPENSLTLKFNWDAKRILEKISKLEKPRIIIAGGGPTGTELAGTLAKKAKVLLIEKSPDILLNFLPKFRNIVKQKLLKKGVEIITNCGVLEVKAGSAILETCGEQKCDLLIWTGGNRGPAAYANSDLELDSRGRVLVNEGLKANEGVFALGDGMSFRLGKCPTGARAAIIQGQLAAKNLLAELGNKPLKKYTGRNYPYLLPLGKYWAAMEIGNWVFSGFWVSLLKKLVNSHYLNREIWS